MWMNSFTHNVTKFLFLIYREDMLEIIYMPNIGKDMCQFFYYNQVAPHKAYLYFLALFLGRFEKWDAHYRKFFLFSKPLEFLFISFMWYLLLGITRKKTKICCMSLCSIKPLAMAFIGIKPAQRKNQSTGPYSGKATPWLKKALHYTYYKAKWRGLLDPNRCWKSTCPLCKSWKPLYYGTCRVSSAIVPIWKFWLAHLLHYKLPKYLGNFGTNYIIFYKCWNSQKTFSSKNTFLWRDNEESIGIFKKDIILVLEMESSNFINYLTDMCWRCSRMYDTKSTLGTVVTRTGVGFEDFGLLTRSARDAAFSEQNRRFVCRYLDIVSCCSFWN